MKYSIILIAFAWAFSSQAGVFPVDNQWTYKKPSEVGMDEAKVQEFLAKFNERTDILIIKDGVIVATKGDPNRYKRWASARKMWLSLIATMMWNDGLIPSLDAPVDYPGLRGNDKGITWRSLMNMQSGYASEDAVNEKFAYSDPAMSLFSAALRRANKPNLTEVIKEFVPELQLQSPDIIKQKPNDYSLANLYDYAKLNLLLLNKGCWNGTRVIKKAVFEDVFKHIATKPVSNSPNVEGGYLDIPYSGSLSNHTKYNRFGSNEYVFNGWINPFERNGMPADFFHGNGHWGRAVAGHSPSLGLVAVVRINQWVTKETDSVYNGPVMANLHLLKEAVLKTEPVVDQCD